MECITVLKNPDFFTDTKDLSATACSCKKPGKSGSGRICSRDWQTVAIGLLLLLLMLAFAFLLILWSIIADYKTELKVMNEKIKENNFLIERLENQINYERQKPSVGDQNKIRKARSNSCTSIPNFDFEGNGKESSGENRFLWKATGNYDMSGEASFTPLTGSGPDSDAVTSVRIGATGVYFIYVQIKVYGHRHRDEHPGVGFTLKRNGVQTLSKAILTQDERGMFYGGSINDWPVDTLALSGIFTLTREDVLSVTPLGHQRSDHHIRYEINQDTSHFGGFLLEKSIC